MQKWGTLVSLIIFLSLPATASVDLGVGMTSAMGGRNIPSLAGGFKGSKWEFTGFATGVQSELYYHSAYGLNAYRHWKSGSILGGTVNSGFGLGVIYASRGFQDLGSTDEEIKSDFAAGPAFEVQWLFVGPLYFRLEAMYGLRNFNAHVALNAQDFVHLSLGFSL